MRPLGPVFDDGDALVLLGAAAVVVVVAFLIGSVSPATILARLLGKDLRASGSGNPGATNAGRVLGVKWGVVVGVLDVAKGFVPTLLVLRAVGSTVAVLVGLALVAGHMFSPFLRGKGGKGVATALGAMLALSPWFALAGIVVFLGSVLAFRITGVASMVTCAALLVAGLVARTGVLGERALGQHPVWVAVVCALVLWRHRVNLKAWIRARRAAD